MRLNVACLVFAISVVLGVALSSDAAVTVTGPDAPRQWEATAVSELKSYLATAVPSGTVTVGGASNVVFHVGDTVFAARKGLSSRALKDEEWVIRSFGGDVVVNGGGTRGCLYAVSHFLEDEVGVRWWSDKEEDVPVRERLDLKALRRRGKPHFLYRNVYRDAAERDPRTMVRRRLNANGADGGVIPFAWGGSIEYGSPKHCHNWDHFIPWAKYGKDHPEWFSLWKGRRIGGQGETGGQLCLTNGEMFEEFRRNLLATIAERYARAKAAGVEPEAFYDVSMNDNWAYCMCPDCEKETAAYGHSGRQLRFVNRLAAAVAKEYPKAYLTVIAYYRGEERPKGGVKAAENVIVKFCVTQQNQVAPFADPTNEKQRTLLESWKDGAENLQVFDYSTTYRQPFVRGLPYPSEFRLGDRVRFYRDRNVVGIFTEHEQQRPLGDMWELKFYVESRLYEDPDLDETQLVREFCRGYFGEQAGSVVFKIRDLLRMAAERKRAQVTWEPQLGSFNFVNHRLLAKLVELFDRAERLAAGDERHLRRVRQARRSVDRLKDLRTYLGGRREPEAGVSDRPFYSMPVNARTTLIWAYHASRKEVEDPEAFEGRAVCEQKSLLPFAAGIHDSYDRKYGKSLPSITASKGPGYHWYSLGTATIPIGYLYWADWGVQTDFAFPELQGRECEIRLHVKFTEKETFVDRMILIPVEK